MIILIKKIKIIIRNIAASSNEGAKQNRTP